MGLTPHRGLRPELRAFRSFRRAPAFARPCARCVGGHRNPPGPNNRRHVVRLAAPAL